MQRPAQNRVTPQGDIVAVSGRGAWMGNRGRLHEGLGTREIVRNHQSKAWLICTLEFRNNRQKQWQPRHYTHLFFLDEAVAFAAGHRPCAECRRADYNSYKEAWARVRSTELPYAHEMDAELHSQRGRVHDWAWVDLPDGTFVVTDEGPAIVLGDRLSIWDTERYGYMHRSPRPTHGTARVLTPRSSLDVMRAGYSLQIDPSAR